MGGAAPKVKRYLDLPLYEAVTRTIQWTLLSLQTLTVDRQSFDMVLGPLAELQTTLY